MNVLTYDLMVTFRGDEAVFNLTNRSRCLQHTFQKRLNFRPFVLTASLLILVVTTFVKHNIHIVMRDLTSGMYENIVLNISVVKKKPILRDLGYQSGGNLVGDILSGWPFFGYGIEMFCETSRDRVSDAPPIRVVEITTTHPRLMYGDGTHEWFKTNGDVICPKKHQKDEGGREQFKDLFLFSKVDYNS
jgi:hypothetical protein